MQLSWCYSKIRKPGSKCSQDLQNGGCEMASNMSLSENIKSFGMKQVIKYLDADPDKNIPRVIEWVEK